MLGYDMNHSLVSPLITIVPYLLHGNIKFDTYEQIAITPSLINLKLPTFYSLQPIYS